MLTFKEYCENRYGESINEGKFGNLLRSIVLSSIFLQPIHAVHADNNAAPQEYVSRDKEERNQISVLFQTAIDDPSPDGQKFIDVIKKHYKTEDVQKHFDDVAYEIMQTDYTNRANMDIWLAGRDYIQYLCKKDPFIKDTVEHMSWVKYVENNFKNTDTLRPGPQHINLGQGKGQLGPDGKPVDPISYDNPTSSSKQELKDDLLFGRKKV